MHLYTFTKQDPEPKKHQISFEVYKMVCGDNSTLILATDGTVHTLDNGRVDINYTMTDICAGSNYFIAYNKSRAFSWSAG